MMSFAPKGISASLPSPVGCCGCTWTQAWMEGSSERIRSKQVCSAACRLLRDAPSHSVNVSSWGVAAGLPVAASIATANPANKKVRRSMAEDLTRLGAGVCGSGVPAGIGTYDLPKLLAILPPAQASYSSLTFALIERVARAKRPRVFSSQSELLCGGNAFPDVVVWLSACRPYIRESES